MTPQDFKNARNTHDKLAAQEAKAEAEGRKAWDDGLHSNKDPYELDDRLSRCWINGFWAKDRAARKSSGGRVSE
jgi:hypothetical protein